jgi:SpoVK/Ycf46/Vps4 family AAA+-type ATPase
VRASNRRADPGDAEAEWSKLAKMRDPLALKVGMSGADLAIYSAIGREFVSDHARGQPVRFSMILYGPPGTGKTNLADELAKIMNYPLITVTVSDFLAEGGLQIEARAKAVFSVLIAQKKSIIIFDEIDHLLLDRNSSQYHDAGSSIQLMVPGMLTKIKDLRSAERSIFIIATNYEERIDGAIKRPGRIDREYLVMPPDWGRRKAIVRSVLNEYSKKVSAIEEDIITEASKSIRLLALTARMSFPEISSVLKDMVSSYGVTNFVAAIEKYPFPEPAAGLDPYLEREHLSKHLDEEFQSLIKIAEEAEEKSQLDLGLADFRARRSDRQKALARTATAE